MKSAGKTSRSKEAPTMTAAGRILIFTGDGKGKTTAALGMVLRAHGHAIPVSAIQFVKSDTEGGRKGAPYRR